MPERAYYVEGQMVLSGKMLILAKDEQHARSIFLSDFNLVDDEQHNRVLKTEHYDLHPDEASSRLLVTLAPIEDALKLMIPAYGIQLEDHDEEDDE